MNYLIGSQQSTHIRVYLYGGPPEASTRIKIVTTDNITGEEASWRSPETCSRGGYVDATYNVNSFDYSIFEREHTLNAYSDDGNLIGTWTGIFTKDFPTHAVRRAREVFFNPFSAGFLGGYGKLLETIRFGSKIKT